jgi:hypothetical protein
MTLNAGTTSLGRPSSGKRDIMSTFNARAPAGASPRAVASHSEVGRDYEGMDPDDWRCPDGRGLFSRICFWTLGTISSAVSV